METTSKSNQSKLFDKEHSQKISKEIIWKCNQYLGLFQAKFHNCMTISLEYFQLFATNNLEVWFNEYGTKRCIFLGWRSKNQ